VRVATAPLADRQTTVAIKTRRPVGAEFILNPAFLALTAADFEVALSLPDFH